MNSYQKLQEACKILWDELIKVWTTIGDPLSTTQQIDRVKGRIQREIKNEEKEQ